MVFAGYFHEVEQVATGQLVIKAIGPAKQSMLAEWLNGLLDAEKAWLRADDRGHVPSQVSSMGAKKDSEGDWKMRALYLHKLLAGFGKSADFVLGLAGQQLAPAIEAEVPLPVCGRAFEIGSGQVFVLDEPVRLPGDFVTGAYQLPNPPRWWVPVLIHGDKQVAFIGGVEAVMNPGEAAAIAGKAFLIFGEVAI